MIKSILVSMTLAFLGFVKAGISTGSCPEVKLQENFDVSKYAGTWYEIARDQSFPGEKFQCQQARYTPKKDGTLNVLNTEYDLSQGKLSGVHGFASCNGPQCQLHFSDDHAGDYRVVASDFKNFSIVYSCSEIPKLGKFEIVWVLSRTPTLSPDTEVTVRAFFEERLPFYNTEQIAKSVQEADCLYIS